MDQGLDLTRGFLKTWVHCCRTSSSPFEALTPAELESPAEPSEKKNGEARKETKKKKMNENLKTHVACGQ